MLRSSLQMLSARMISRAGSRPFVVMGAFQREARSMRPAQLPVIEIFARKRLDDSEIRRDVEIARREPAEMAHLPSLLDTIVGAIGLYRAARLSARRQDRKTYGLKRLRDEGRANRQRRVPAPERAQAPRHRRRDRS